MSVLNFSSIILSGSRVTFTIIRNNGWRILCWPINLLHSHCSYVSPPPSALLLSSCTSMLLNELCLYLRVRFLFMWTDQTQRKLQSALTKDLYFNVSRFFNKLLNKQGSVPKSRQGFRVGPLVILLKFLTNRQEKSICVWVRAAIQEAIVSEEKDVCLSWIWCSTDDISRLLISAWRQLI